MTQVQLADQLHVTDKAVSKWERDLSYPDMALFPKLADILGVNVNDLLKECLDEGQPSRLVQIFEMSQDIRTPLHIILGCADMAENHFELKAFVTNLGKYNEGELVGEWVSFPTTPEELKQVYERIGIGHADDFGNPYEEIFITDYDSDLYGITEELGEYSSLEAINYLGARLEELDRYDLEKYKAVLESGVGLPESGITGLINLTYNLDRFEIIPDVHDDSDLGYYYVEEAGIYDTKSMGALARYIDYEAFGRDVRLEEGGTYSDAGYVRDDNSSWDYEFDGTREGIPEEYLLFVNDEDHIIFSEQEKETILKAMEAARYSFDKMESTDDNLRFLSEGGAVMQMGGWDEATAVSDRVEKILHPERFEGQGITEIKPFSVLKELAEKKKEAIQARPLIGKSAKIAGAEIG